jgi:hypothetical protein
MAMSGVEVDPASKQAFEDTMKGHMYRYVTYKIDDGKVRIDKVIEGLFHYSYDAVME